jgi:hypothetical protein
MIRKVVGPGRLSVGRCSRSGVRNQRVVPVLVGRLRYTGGVSHLLGYALVSTAEQNADLQTGELTAAGCWRVWTDHASGVLDRRPQLDELLGHPGGVAAGPARSITAASDRCRHRPGRPWRGVPAAARCHLANKHALATAPERLSPECLQSQ